MCLLLASCSEEVTSPLSQTDANNDTSSADQFWQALYEITKSDTPTLDALNDINPLGSQVTQAQRQYVKALRAMALNNIEEASDLFLTITPSELPPGFLYPSYRAVHTAAPDKENPFREPLLKLAQKEKLPALWKARLFRDEGRFLDALTAYWRSPPAEWTMCDVDCLIQISTLQGAKPDVHSLVRKALATKQLNSSVETALQGELMQETASLPPASLEQNLQRVQQEIDGNTATGKAIVESIKQSFDLRKLFLDKDYKGVMAHAGNKDPIHQSDETLLITFLSASHLLDIKQTTRWGQEIVRRKKEPESKTWVANIIQETETAAQTSSSSSPGSAPSF